MAENERYVVCLDKRVISGKEVISSIGILEEREYMQTHDNHPANNHMAKVVDKYPLDLELRFRIMFGKPNQIGEKSFIFYISKELQGCVQRMFKNLERLV